MMRRLATAVVVLAALLAPARAQAHNDYRSITLQDEFTQAIDAQSFTSLGCWQTYQVVSGQVAYVANLNNGDDSQHWGVGYVTLHTDGLYYAHQAGMTDTDTGFSTRQFRIDTGGGFDATLGTRRMVTRFGTFGSVVIWKLHHLGGYYHFRVRANC
jgi:hypothetical protein